MFVSDYLEFKSKARKEIKDVVFKAIEIYKVLEYKKINYYSHSMEKSMDMVDKYSFATLIAILDSDKKLNSLLQSKDIFKYVYEYNKISPNDDLGVINAKLIAQKKQLDAEKTTSKGGSPAPTPLDEKNKK